MTRLWALVIVGLGLAGCAAVPRPACPAGQAQIRTAQIFLVAKPPARLSERDLLRFVDQEVTPRFPDGVSVVDGGGQWKGADQELIRQAAKVLLIVLPQSGDAQARVDAIRGAYHARFKQDALVVVPPPSCVSL